MVQIKISALNAIKSNIYRQESDTKVNHLKSILIKRNFL